MAKVARAIVEVGEGKNLDTADLCLGTVGQSKRQQSRDNNFRMRVRAKGTAYVAWPYFTVYFGLTDAARRGQWLTPTTIAQGVEADKL